MKAFIFAAIFGAHVGASALTIRCANKGNPADQMSISFSQAENLVVGASIFNQSLEQTEDGNYHDTQSQYIYYGYFVSVSLVDGMDILIPNIVLDGATKGIVHTGDGREYICN